MKLEERIPIIMKEFKSTDRKIAFIKYLFPEKFNTGVQLNLFQDGPEEFLQGIVKRWESAEERIKSFWIENANLRLVQVLLSLDIINYDTGFWFYTDENSFLLKNKFVKERDITFWGQNYNEKGELLPETRYILIKDMSTSHIESIIKDFIDCKSSPSTEMLRLFLKELYMRRNEIY